MIEWEEKDERTGGEGRKNGRRRMIECEEKDDRLGGEG